MAPAVSRLAAALTLLGLTWMGPLLVRPGEAATLPPAREQFAQAFQRLGHVPRFQLTETVVQASAPAASEGLRYVSPDRLAMVAELRESKERTAAVESVQVGATKCQSPPRAWVCFHSTRPDVPTLVRALLEPKLQHAEFRATPGSGGSLDIRITGSRNNVAYAGVLVLAAHSGLSRTFRSTVHQGGRLLVTQSVSFTYGGRYSINLPKAKGTR
jgi:hypothetical protein